MRISPWIGLSFAAVLAPPAAAQLAPAKFPFKQHVEISENAMRQAIEKTPKRNRLKNLLEVARTTAYDLRKKIVKDVPPKEMFEKLVLDYGTVALAGVEDREPRLLALAEVELHLARVRPDVIHDVLEPAIDGFLEADLAEIECKDVYVPAGETAEVDKYQIPLTATARAAYSMWAAGVAARAATWVDMSEKRRKTYLSRATRWFNGATKILGARPKRGQPAPELLVGAYLPILQAQLEHLDVSKSKLKLPRTMKNGIPNVGPPNHVIWSAAPATKPSDWLALRSEPGKPPRKRGSNYVPKRMDVLAPIASMDTNKQWWLQTSFPAKGKGSDLPSKQGFALDPKNNDGYVQRISFAVRFAQSGTYNLAMQGDDGGDVLMDGVLIGSSTGDANAKRVYNFQFGARAHEWKLFEISSFDHKEDCFINVRFEKRTGRKVWRDVRALDKVAGAPDGPSYELRVLASEAPWLKEKIPTAPASPFIQ